MAKKEMVYYGQLKNSKLFFGVPHLATFIISIFLIMQ
jgi:hypothetical protein